MISTFLKSFSKKALKRPDRNALPSFPYKIPKFVKAANQTPEIREELRKFKHLVDSSDKQMIVNSKDIHEALRQSGALPETRLESILKETVYLKYKEDAVYRQAVQSQINSTIVDQTASLLNESLVSCLKAAKKHHLLFQHFEKFWLAFEKEVQTRFSTLSNEDLTDIVDSFSYSKVKTVSLLEILEEELENTSIPFLVYF